MPQPSTSVTFASIDPAAAPAPTGDQNVVFQGTTPGSGPMLMVSAYPKTATSSLRGVVKPDGATTSVDGSGNLSAAIGGVSTKTTNYTAVSGDIGKLLVFNSSSAVTLTLPSASPFAQWTVSIQNIGTGTLTVNRNGLNIDGAGSNLTLATGSGVQIATDGTNYFTERGLGSGNGGPTKSDIQQEAYTYAADSGAANAYAVTLSPAPTIVAGSMVQFKAANANTGASTLAVNGAGAVAIRKDGVSPLVSGDISAGQIVSCIFDGTYYQAIGLAPALVLAPAIRGSGATTALATSITISFPSGTVAGDLAILFCCNSGNNISVPSGWTSVAATGGGTWVGFVASKVLSSGDISTGSVTVNVQGPIFSPNSDAIAEIVTFIGATAGVRESPGGNVGGTSGTFATSTSSAVQPTDVGLFFGAGGVPSGFTASVSPGTTLQTPSTAYAVGVLAAETMPGGVTAVSFVYTGTPAAGSPIQYVVIVEGAASGVGTVSSVGLTVPSRQSVSGSPVTSAGTMAITDNVQSANTFFKGPNSGSPATPTFAAIVPADLPVFVASGGSHAAGGVPDPGSSSGTTKFLREDATWAVPPGTGGGGSSPTTTKGDLAGYDTASARIPVGADGKVLTADSTQALGVKWAAAGGGGTSPEVHSFSAVSSIAFTTCITSSSKFYRLDFCITGTGTSIQLFIDFSTNGGATWDTTTSTHYGKNYAAITTGGSGGQQGNATGGIDISCGGTLNISTSYPFAGHIFIYDPLGSTYKQLVGQINGYYGGNQFLQNDGWSYDNTNAINAFRIRPSSGTITGTASCQPL